MHNRDFEKALEHMVACAKVLAYRCNNEEEKIKYYDMITDWVEVAYLAAKGKDFWNCVPKNTKILVWNNNKSNCVERTFYNYSNNLIVTRDIKVDGDVIETKIEPWKHGSLI